MDGDSRDHSQWPILNVGDIAEITERSLRKVQMFVEQGVIEPTFQPSGRGYLRGFTILDLLRIGVAQKLERFGIAPRFRRAIVKEFSDRRLRKTNPREFPVVAWITPRGTSGFDVEFTDEDERMLLALGRQTETPSGFAIRIPLRDLFDELREKAHRYSQEEA